MSYTVNSSKKSKNNTTFKVRRMYNIEGIILTNVKKCCTSVGISATFHSTEFWGQNPEHVLFTVEKTNILNIKRFNKCALSSYDECIIVYVYKYKYFTFSDVVLSSFVDSEKIKARTLFDREPYPDKSRLDVRVVVVKVPVAVLEEDGAGVVQTI